VGPACQARRGRAAVAAEVGGELMAPGAVVTMCSGEHEVGEGGEVSVVEVVKNLAHCCVHTANHSWLGGSGGGQVKP
jgi:hypothetical protein